jgi:hypothetical protein
MKKKSHLRMMNLTEKNRSNLKRRPNHIHLRRRLELSLFIGRDIAISLYMFM